MIRGISFGGSILLQWSCVCIRRGKVVGNTKYVLLAPHGGYGGHGGSRKGDEQQLLMRWGSTLRPFTARIAASNQILHQKYLSWASGFS